MSVAIRPVGPGLLDPATWWSAVGAGGEAFVEQAARLTLAVSPMGVALRLKREDVRGLARPVLVLLGLPPWLALLLGAVVTPTDPVVASSIVTGPFAEDNLPNRTRDTISFRVRGQ